MNILIINSGSSSIKFQVLQMPAETVLCSGIVERIGSYDAVVQYKTSNDKVEETIPVKTHENGLQHIAALLLHPEKGVIKNSADIKIVGHRVVHGGNSFSETMLVNDAVKHEIEQCAALAPLHNPNNLIGIIIAEKLFPNAKQVAVFDTAFHQTIPEKAKRYAIPEHLYNEHHIQLYGFHGTSHKYVTDTAIAYLKLKQSKIISIHLGNGCSMTAVLDGKSMDHSLGFAPGNGLIMGSRSGDIDHAVIFYLVNTLGYNLEQVNNLLNKESGMLGLTGYSDLRDIQREAENGNLACNLALAMNAYRIKKYIGAYAAAMNGLDAIIFTAGIGENSSLLRDLVCADMEFLGMHLDTVKNEERQQVLREINTSDSQVKILVVPTNEELEIAKQAYQLLV